MSAALPRSRAPAFAPRTAVPERCGRLFFSVCLRPGPAHPIDKGAIVMKCERIPLGAQGAYLDTYFLADSPELKAGACRPAVVVCPGGGYAYTSDREAEPIALALCARGFHACVLRYPCAPARFPAALRALAEAVAWVRAGAAEKPCGPAANLRMRFFCGRASGGQPWCVLERTVPRCRNRPCPPGHAPGQNGALLPRYYRREEFAHKGSFDNLLGADADAARRAEVSLEQHVTQDTPPAFLWHTYTDPGVPVENTMLFAMALPVRANRLSPTYRGRAAAWRLANELTENTAGAGVQAECTGWVDLAAGWLRR